MREETHPLPSKWICCSRKKKIPEQERKDWPFRIKWIAMHLFSILQITRTKIALSYTAILYIKIVLYDNTLLLHEFI